MTAPFIVSQPLVSIPPPDGTAPGIDAGVLGLEARHTWYGDLGPVALNYLWDDDGKRAVLAINGQSVRADRVGAAALYRLTRIQGLHARADAEDNRAALTGRLGEEIYPSQMRGKTVTYEGTIVGATLADLRRAEAQLRRATAGTYSGYMVVEPHPTYGAVPYAYFARCTQLDIADEVTTSATSTWGPHQRNFVLAFRQHDPRYYVWEQRTDTANANGLVGTTITNQGTAPSDPIITVRPVLGGHISNLEVNNDTIGAVLALDSAISGAGITLNFLTGVNGYITINFLNRSIVNETGFSLLRCLDIGSSTWWDDGVMGLAPGDNLIRVEAPATGTFDVAWLDASW